MCPEAAGVIDAPVIVLSAVATVAAACTPAVRRAIAYSEVTACAARLVFMHASLVSIRQHYYGYGGRHVVQSDAALKVRT